MGKLDDIEDIAVVGGTGHSPARSVAVLEPGEPAYMADPYNKTCWYTYTPAVSGNVYFDWTESIQATPYTVGITLYIRTSGTGTPTWGQLAHHAFSIVTGANFAAVGGVTYYIQAATNNIANQPIGTITGPNTVPPDLPPMSSLTDAFSNLNAGKWTWSGPVVSYAGMLELGDDAGNVGTHDSWGTYDFDRAEVAVVAAGTGVGMTVYQDGGDDWVSMGIRNTPTWHVWAAWDVGGVAGDAGTGTEYAVETHKHLRLLRNITTETVAFQWSTDGVSWETIWTLVLTGTQILSARVVLHGNHFARLDNFNIVTVEPGETPVDPGTSVPDTIPDSTDLDAEAPPIGTDPDTIGEGESPPQPTCLTVLELIRQFSAQISAPVRIVGPKAIEIVDVNAPLPTGWTLADTADLYSSTTRALTAGERTLSLDTEGGVLAMECSADLVTDDVRLVVSDWRLPGQLPIYGLSAGLVKRVSYAFTPEHFRGSVEFHLASVPIAARRR